MNALIEQLNYLISILTSVKQNQPTLYQIALKNIGIDASPNDLVPDELGCAETVSNIIQQYDSSFPIITGTWTLWDYLRRHPKARQVTIPMPGAIVISPTGESKHGRKAPFVGHTGFVSARNTIMSNDSATGKLLINYTVDTWKARWEKEGGYPVYYFTFV